MDIKAIQDYLHLLQMDMNYKVQPIDCEICGSSKQLELMPQIKGPRGHSVSLPIVGCINCGHIYQSYRFESRFYHDYYDKYYRLNLFGESSPDKEYFWDQIKRGDYLYKSLRDWLPPKGRLLDVGCSAGGLMIPFAKKGWIVKGNDPDKVYAEYGKSLGLNIETVSAEEMSTHEQADLIIINGSLEHVYDLNKVLERCKKISSPEGLLLIEGRALGYGMQQGYLTHNHRRFLTPHSIELLMLKHGWNPILKTDTPLCGPTRPGAVFVLGRNTALNDNNLEFDRVCEVGKEHLQNVYYPWFEKVIIA